MLAGRDPSVQDAARCWREERGEVPAAGQKGIGGGCQQRSRRMGLTADGPVQTRLYQKPALMQIQCYPGRQVKLLSTLSLWFQEDL